MRVCGGALRVSERVYFVGVSFGFVWRFFEVKFVLGAKSAGPVIGRWKLMRRNGWVLPVKRS